MTIEQEKFAGGIGVVTGAGGGIGMGIARTLAQAGMTVVIADIAGDRAEAVAAHIRDDGGKAEALTVDVSRWEALDRLAETVFDRHGPVRVLVNNAGIETLGLSWEIPPKRWEATLDINVHGIVHGCRAFVPRMIAAGEEAWIANLASVGAFGAMPTQAAYVMSKHAIQAFSECLYLEMELAQAPIHVSSIIPGTVRSGIFAAAAGAGEPDGAERHRRAMREMLEAYGISPEEAGARIVRQMAENRFWVDTHPEMTAELVEARIAFFQRQVPQLTENARALLGV